MSSFWNKFFIISCKKYCEYASMDIDGAKLNQHEKVSMKLHHFVCTFCRRYSRQLKLIEAATKNMLIAEKSIDANLRLNQSARDKINKAIISANNEYKS
jgi:hypothetical protein